MFIAQWFRQNVVASLIALGLSQKKARIVLLGLDNAGKTTLLHALQHDRLSLHEPTKHPQLQELVIGNITFKAHDLGGHMAARRLWKNYFCAVDAVVFLVDAADAKRFPECQRE